MDEQTSEYVFKFLRFFSHLHSSYRSEKKNSKQIAEKAHTFVCRPGGCVMLAMHATECDRTGTVGRCVVALEI